jgi:hypothetical protein
MTKLRRIISTYHAPHMRETRNAYKSLFGKPEVTRLLGRPRLRWEVYIQMYLKIKCQKVNWIELKW